MTLALILTAIVETSLFALVFKVRGRGLAVVALAQGLTNPIVNIIAAIHSYDMTTTIVLEVLAVLSEALIYKAFKVCKRPLFASLVANATSYGLGLLLSILPPLLARM